MEQATTLVKATKDVERVKNITTTILKQLKYPNINVYYSWGSHAFCYAVTSDGKPCLRFKVNGNKFKGYVHIIYNWADYYEIEFVTTHGNLKKRVDICYCDMLQEIIDEYVEKIPEYIY